MIDFKTAIRSIPDFPKKGIVFRDITTLLLNPEAFRTVLDKMQDFCLDKKVDYVIGIESRGFILGGALADRLGVGFIPIRKKGKLPGQTIRYDYQLEYGADTIEIHADALSQGQSVLIVDDLAATGGTLAAAAGLVEKTGAEVAGIALLVDLAYLPWREKVNKYKVLSLVTYDSE
nr:adenine phosphoribosyltransferase [candidate division Zixibacteria bacterium]